MVSSPGSDVCRRYFRVSCGKVRYATYRSTSDGPFGLGRGLVPVISPTVSALSEISEQFRLLPEMAKKYVPRSEHIFKKLQPVLEDQLFLGQTYDSLFDEFKISLALTYSDVRDEKPSDHAWGPSGRFAWKERGIFTDDPVYSRFVAGAK